MLVACWSSKGGAGTTVVAASLGLIAGARSGDGALLVDLAGDLPAVLGQREPESPGVAGWLAAGPDVPDGALARLEVPVAPGVALLPRGVAPIGVDRADALASHLAADPRTVVVDCGTAPERAAAVLARTAERSVLVTRACFISLRRAMTSAVRATEVVLVAEPGRALTRHDVGVALGVPVTAVVDIDPAVARAVDAGLLAGRLPRGLARELRDVG
jgi:MinD-like ATPase involved in chromosome partitioning or flagellar assembly